MTRVRGFICDGSKRPNKNIRRNVGETFGNRCVHCGAAVSDEAGNRHIDHWIPRDRFERAPLDRWFSYRDKPFNLVCSCRKCNLRKHTKLPNMEHPFSVRFFLHCCAEELCDAWEKGAEPPQDVREYWAGHEGLWREAAEIYMESKQQEIIVDRLEVVVASLNEQFQKENQHHCIDARLLRSDACRETIQKYKDMKLLGRALRMAVEASCGYGVEKGTLGLYPKTDPRGLNYKYLYERDAWFLGVVWPAMCEAVLNGRGLKPVHAWERLESYDRLLDSLEEDHLDELAGCREKA